VIRYSVGEWGRASSQPWIDRIFLAHRIMYPVQLVILAVLALLLGTLLLSLALWFWG
jgi:hypothetical protein